MLCLKSAKHCQSCRLPPGHSSTLLLNERVTMDIHRISASTARHSADGNSYIYRVKRAGKQVAVPSSRVPASQDLTAAITARTNELSTAISSTQCDGAPEVEFTVFGTTDSTCLQATQESHDNVDAVNPPWGASSFTDAVMFSDARELVENVVVLAAHDHTIQQNFEPYNSASLDEQGLSVEIASDNGAPLEFDSACLPFFDENICTAMAVPIILEDPVSSDHSTTNMHDDDFAQTSTDAENDFEIFHTSEADCNLQQFADVSSNPEFAKKQDSASFCNELLLRVSQQDKQILKLQQDLKEKTMAVQQQFRRERRLKQKQKHLLRVGGIGPAMHCEGFEEPKPASRIRKFKVKSKSAEPGVNPQQQVHLQRISCRKESLIQGRKRKSSSDDGHGQHKLQCSNTTKRENLQKTTRYWTTEEHDKFMEGKEKYGLDYEALSAFIGTRTPTQVRTHCQKFTLKVVRDNTPAQGSCSKANAVLEGALAEGASLSRLADGTASVEMSDTCLHGPCRLLQPSATHPPALINEGCDANPASEEHEDSTDSPRAGRSHHAPVRAHGCLAPSLLSSSNLQSLLVADKPSMHAPVLNGLVKQTTAEDDNSLSAPVPSPSDRQLQARPVAEQGAVYPHGAVTCNNNLRNIGSFADVDAACILEVMGLPQYEQLKRTLSSWSPIIHRACQVCTICHVAHRHHQ
eukprot:jgi/Mesvir1/24714/Mv21989-RA.2